MIEKRQFIFSDGTVTDTTTGLMWQQETARRMSWEAAISYCKGLTVGGYRDWRLPTIQELQSIVDYTRYGPTIDTTAFPGIMSSYYWSSTTDADYTYNAWCMNFYGGDLDYNDKSYSYYVRAVRGEQQ